MESECRDYLRTHNRIPPKRCKIPAHTGLRQFVICDASTLLDSTGAPANDTFGTILCLHSQPQRMETVVTSLFERTLPSVLDADAYEEDNEMKVEELYDDDDDDVTGDDDWMLDTELLAMKIDDDELVRADGSVVYTQKWPFHVF